MKHFKILLLSLLLLAPVQAFAAWNIQQGADGGTYWVDTDDSDTVHVSEGRVILYVSDISVSSTGFVVAPVKGVIEKVYSVIHNRTTSADEPIKLFIGSGATGTTDATVAWTEVTNGTAPLTITSTSVTGAVDSATYSSSNTVVEGSPIAIRSGGASAPGGGTTVPATFTIIINPQ